MCVYRYHPHVRGKDSPEIFLAGKLLQAIECQESLTSLTSHLMRDANLSSGRFGKSIEDMPGKSSSQGFHNGGYLKMLVYTGNSYSN